MLLPSPGVPPSPAPAQPGPPPHPSRAAGVPLPAVFSREGGPSLRPSLRASCSPALLLGPERRTPTRQACPGDAGAAASRPILPSRGPLPSCSPPPPSAAPVPRGPEH